jgi:hypothetical protein
MKIRKLWQGLLFTAFAFTGFAAHAGLILTLEDGAGNTASVSDDDGDGLVQFIGALGTWTVNATTGITNPLIGSEHSDEIDLNSVNVSGGSGSLYITLTRSGLERSPASWIANLGGTTSGTIDFATFLNGALISEYSASTSAFSNSDSGQIDQLEAYSLTLAATIHHDGGGQVSSFDYHVKVPEPSTLALLGSGLLLTGWMGRRRKLHGSL